MNPAHRDSHISRSQRRRHDRVHPRRSQEQTRGERTPINTLHVGPNRGSRQRAYLYLTPALAFYTAFVALPWLHTMWLSLFTWDGVATGTWKGLGNYREVISDPVLASSLLHAFGFILFYSLLPIVIGLLLVGVLVSRGPNSRSLSRTVFLLPQVVPLVAIGVIWRGMYASEGVINQILRAVGLGGLTRAWLGDFTWAYAAVGLVGTWAMFGLCLILFHAGVQRIDTNLYEAARIDGAGRVREFFAVTLPGLRREIGVAATITVVAALANFDVVYVTTGGGPGDSTMVPGVLIYRLAFNDGRVGAACALAVVLSAVISAAVLVIVRLTRQRT